MTLQLLLEEFGKWLNASVDATMEQRDKYFAVVYNESQRLMQLPGSPLKVKTFILLISKSDRFPGNTRLAARRSLFC
jgi:hypothetical protein